MKIKRKVGDKMKSWEGKLTVKNLNLRAEVKVKVNTNRGGLKKWRGVGRTKQWREIGEIFKNQEGNGFKSNLGNILIKRINDMGPPEVTFDFVINEPSKYLINQFE